MPDPVPTTFDDSPRAPAARNGTGVPAVRPWTAFKGQTSIAANQSPPTSITGCVHTQQSYIEWLVKPPAGVTRYTVVLGRWCRALQGTHEVVDEWVETHRIDRDGPSARMIPAVETGLDRCALYITGIQGDATGEFSLFYRHTSIAPVQLT